MALAKKGQDYAERLGLASTAEGVMIVLIEQGHQVASARQQVSETLLQGQPLPLPSKTLQSYLHAAVEARWADLSMNAVDQLQTLLETSGSERIRFDAARTILDRGGHGSSNTREDTGRKGAKTVEELEAEMERITALLEEGGDTINA